jgi:hypothetical protein
MSNLYRQVLSVLQVAPLRYPTVVPTLVALELLQYRLFPSGVGVIVEPGLASKEEMQFRFQIVSQTYL